MQFPQVWYVKKFHSLYFSLWPTYLHYITFTFSCCFSHFKRVVVWAGILQWSWSWTMDSLSTSGMPTCDQVRQCSHPTLYKVNILLPPIWAWKTPLGSLLDELAADVSIPPNLGPLNPEKYLMDVDGCVSLTSMVCQSSCRTAKSSKGSCWSCLCVAHHSRTRPWGPGISPPVPVESCFTVFSVPSVPTYLWCYVKHNITDMCHVPCYQGWWWRIFKIYHVVSSVMFWKQMYLGSETL